MSSTGGGTGGSGASADGGDIPGLLALLLQRFRDQEGELDRLRAVEARIAMGVIAVGEVDLADRLGAAHAFGDVLAGELEMHAAGARPFGAMHGEEAGQLVMDVVEAPGFVAVRGFQDVAVHGIAGPDDAPTLALDGA